MILEIYLLNRKVKGFPELKALRSILCWDLMMQKITEGDLVEKYPLIFQDRYASVRDSCMAFGIESGPGWYPILDVLFERITQYCDEALVQ